MRNWNMIRALIASVTVALFGLAQAADMKISTGWSLVGFSGGTAVNVEDVFGNASTNDVPNVTTNVTSVWKWVDGGWQFWTPALDRTALESYAASKGYQVLSQLQPGDGYWINAKAPITLNDFAASPTKLGTFETLRKVNSSCHGYTFNPNDADVAIALSGGQLSITEDDFFDKRCVYTATSISSPITGTFRCANNNFDEGTFTLTGDKQHAADDIRLAMDVVTTNRVCNYSVKFIGFRAGI